MSTWNTCFSARGLVEIGPCRLGIDIGIIRGRYASDWHCFVSYVLHLCVWVCRSSRLVDPSTASCLHPWLNRTAKLFPPAIALVSSALVATAL